MRRRRAVIFDTVVLSNFALSGSLDIILQRYGSRGTLTPEVLDEIADGIVAGHAPLRAVEDAVTAGRLACTPRLESREERGAYRGLLRSLGPGEASCIAFAAVHGGTVATDDRTARDCCDERGIPYTGTVGILKACCLDGTLGAQHADAVLEKMIAAGYHAPVRRVSDVM